MAFPQRDVQEVSNAIRKLDEEARRNIQAGNADAMVDGYYADDAKVLPPGQGMLVGKPAIREMWRAIVEGGMVDLTLKTENIETTGDIAFGTGTAIALTRRADAPAVVHEGRYVVVFRRQPDRTWRNIVDMYSIDAERPT